MAALLKDLRGLDIHVVAPPDRDGQVLADQLRRIGCTVTAHWPLPSRLPPRADVVFVSIDDGDHDAVRRLLAGEASALPTLIAVVGYENPATLQIVLEHPFSAIVERPIRSFGLLANLVIARNLWLQHQSTMKTLNNYKRRALGDQKVARAKAVLMATQGLSEDEAYRELRARAQSARIAIERIAESVLEQQSGDVRRH